MDQEETLNKEKSSHAATSTVCQGSGSCATTASNFKIAKLSKRIDI